MSRTMSRFFSSLGLQFTAKSLRAFMVTNWRKARVPDDALRGRVGHDEATPVTDRHYHHHRDAVADRKETDLLVGPLLYEPTTAVAARTPADRCPVISPRRRPGAAPDRLEDVPFPRPAGVAQSGSAGDL